MMNFFKSKKGMITIGVIVVLLVAYFAWKQNIDAYFKRKMGKVEGDPNDADNNLDTEMVLMKGSKGLEVKALQAAIINDGGKMPEYGADGIFGMETENALMKVASVKKISLAAYAALSTSAIDVQVTGGVKSAQKISSASVNASA